MKIKIRNRNRNRNINNKIKPNNFLDHNYKNNEKSLNPSIKYIIAALPRTGSNLIVRQLARSGVGLVAEYFHPLVAGDFAKSINNSEVNSVDYAEFVIKNRQSTENIFGSKIHWHQFDDLKNEVKNLISSNAKFICTRRRNLAWQAFSHEKAAATGQWDPRWKPDPNSRFPDADPNDMKKLILRSQDIVETEVKWFSWFQRSGCNMINIFYEDLMCNPVSVYSSIYDFLGVEGDFPETEPAPEGKTGSDAGEFRIISELEERLASMDLDRPALS